MKKIEQPYYKPKMTPKIRVELDNSFQTNCGLGDQIYFVMLLTLF